MLSGKSNSLRLFIRAMALLWKNDCGLFVSCFADQVLSALIPFVYIYISSLIIGELAADRSEARLVYFVLLLLGASLVFETVRSLVQRWANICTDRFQMNKEHIFSEKMFSMSFEDVDSPHIRKTLDQIKQNERFAGFGLVKVIEIYENAIRALTQIVVSCVLCYPMFFSDVPASRPQFLFLNNPVCIVVLFVLLCGITVLSPVLSNRAKKYWAGLAQKATQENRLYSFYGFFANDDRRAPDIRIYDQNELCRRWFFENNSFGGSGEIARYAKGRMGIMNALSVAVSYMFTGLVYLYVCTKAWAGAFGIGAASRYIGAVTSLLHGGAGFVSVCGDLIDNAPFLETVFAFLDGGNEAPLGSAKPQELLDENNFRIEFRDVYFKYPNAEEWALKHVNLTIDQGTSLVVVGKNGSGKSTFVKLLCGLYKPTKGRISLNGTDISDIDFEQYRSIISTVFQDFNLPAFRLNENVACGNSCDRKRVEQAAAQVGMHEQIMRYKDAYESYLTKKFSTDGIDLSGGEEQRLAIARALYKNAEVLVMDEPTASVDPVTENDLLEKINRITEEKTVVFVSHRLSLCTVFDEIIVFQDGELVQRGTHRELCENKEGQYFKLWNAQAKFYDL